MFVPFAFAAFVVMAPLDPGADQATLTQLFKDGIDTAFEQRAPERDGVVRTWIGAGCVSVIAVREPAGSRSAYRIPWSEIALVPPSDEMVVAVSGLKPAKEGTLDHPTLFRFRDAETARTAREAMQRLKDACTAQR